MKYLIFAFFIFLNTNQGFAQNDFEISIGTMKAQKYGTSVDTFYQESKDDNFTSEKSSHIALIQKTDMRRGIILNIFDFDTQKIVKTVRMKAVSHNEKPVFLFDDNYSFLSSNKKVKTVATNKGRTQTLYDVASNLKIMQSDYSIKKGSVLLTNTLFYSNGNIRYQETVPIGNYANEYHNYGINNFQLVGDIALKNHIHQNITHGLLNNYNNPKLLYKSPNRQYNETFFYPNGKRYIYLEKKIEDGIFTEKNAAIQVWDSTGRALKGANYLNIATQKPNNTWLCFSESGKINDIFDFDAYKGVVKQYTMFDKYNTAVIFSKKIYFYTKNSILMAYNSAYNQFSSHTNGSPAYKSANTYIYEYLKRYYSITTPIFTLSYDNNKILTNANISNGSFSYAKEACPAQQPFIIEGNYANNMPEGRFLIFKTDSLGKKTDLLLSANFNNGLLDGECIGFCSNAKKQIVDTLYHVVFRKGVIIKDKYSDAFIKKQEAKQNIIDSTMHLTEAQMIACKANALPQHALYKAGKSNIWQRDTFDLFDYNNINNKYSNEKPIKEQYKVNIIQYDSSIAAKVYINIRSTIIQDTIDFVFNKKTLDLEDIATIHRPRGLENSYFDIKNKRIATVNDYNLVKTAILNDSVVRYDDYTHNSTESSSTMDTICRNCSYPKGIKNKIECSMKVKKDIAKLLLLETEYKNTFSANIEDWAAYKNVFFDINITIPPIKTSKNKSHIVAEVKKDTIFKKECADANCRTYTRTGFVFDKQIKYAYTAVFTADTLQILSVYYLDTLQNNTPYWILKIEKQNRYAYNEWYESGKVRYKNAYLRNIKNDDYLEHIESKLNWERMPYLPNKLYPFLKYYENGNLETQCGIAQHYFIQDDGNNTNIYTLSFLQNSYYEDGSLKEERINPNLKFNYPDFKSKENCIWEHLPIQEGKFADGHRVGLWQGFERNEKKTLRYEINYDEAGLVEGEVVIYTEKGDLFTKTRFEKGRIKDSLIQYKSNKTYEIQYYNAEGIYKIKYYNDKGIFYHIAYIVNNTMNIDTFYHIKEGGATVHYYKNGKLIGSTTLQKGSLLPIQTIIDYGDFEAGAITTDYYPNGRIKHIKDDFTQIETDIDAQGIAKTKFNFSDYNLINSPEQAKKRWQPTQFEPLPPISTKNKIEMLPFTGLANGLTLDYHFAKNGSPQRTIADAIVAENKDIITQKYTATLDKLCIKDQKGGILTLDCSKKAPIKADILQYQGIMDTLSHTLKAYNNSLTDKNKALNIKYSAYPPAGATPKTAIRSAKFSNPYDVSAFISYNPRLVHQLIAPSNAGFEIRFDSLTFERQGAAYYIPQDSLAFYQTKKSIRETEKYVNSIKFCEKTSFYIATQPLSQDYQYEIGTSKMTFITKEERITNALPYLENESAQNSVKIAYLPFHASANDAFLNDGSLRIFSQKGFFFLPFAPEIRFPLYNLLIDQTEINGAFVVKKADNLKDKILTFAQQNGIQVVFIPVRELINQGFDMRGIGSDTDTDEICAFRFAQK